MQTFLDARIQFFMHVLDSIENSQGGATPRKEELLLDSHLAKIGDGL